MVATQRLLDSVAATALEVLRRDHIANGVSEPILSTGLEDMPSPPKVLMKETQEV